MHCLVLKLITAHGGSRIAFCFYFSASEMFFIICIWKKQLRVRLNEQLGFILLVPYHPLAMFVWYRFNNELKPNISRYEYSHVSERWARPSRIGE